MQNKSKLILHEEKRSFLKNPPNKGLQGPSPSAIKYTGSAAPKGGPVSSDRLVAKLQTASAVSFTPSAGTATFSTVYTAGSATSASDWTDYAALYQEFRVLSVEVQYLPKIQYSTDLASSGGVPLGVTLTPLYFAPYHGDATALTSHDAALNHASRVRSSIDHPQQAVVRMSESDESVFNSTTSGTASLMGIKSYLNIAAASNSLHVFGWVLLTHTVQFRSRVVSATQISQRLPSLSLPNSLSIVPLLEIKQASPEKVQQTSENTFKKESKSEVIKPDDDQYFLVRRPLTRAVVSSSSPSSMVYQSPASQQQLCKPFSGQSSVGASLQASKPE
jgi:hypothetical protein